MKLTDKTKIIEEIIYIKKVDTLIFLYDFLTKNIIIRVIHTMEIIM